MLCFVFYASYSMNFYICISLCASHKSEHPLLPLMASFRVFLNNGRFKKSNTWNILGGSKSIISEQIGKLAIVGLGDSL